MRWSVALPEPHAGSPVSASDLAVAARAVEAAGFDAGWLTDHPFPVVEEGKPGHHAWDLFSAFSFLAASTARLLLHTSLVVVPYRNPFLLAKQAATLHHLSGGRLLMSIGAGYLKPEFAALGVEYDGREEMMRDGVRAMRAAWTGEPVELSSPDWVVAGNTALPALPEPPRIWRGGNSRPCLEHAAAELDGWIPVEMPAERAQHTRTTPLSAAEGLLERIGLFRRLEAEAGRSGLDICLVRPRFDWTRRDAGEVREELAHLEEQGVSWIATGLDAHGRDEFERRLDALAGLVQ